MNKIVNGVANDFEFETLNISDGNGNIGQLFEEKNKKIERLNNIINELEKYLDEQMSKNVYEDEYTICFNDKGTAYFNCLDKLKALKGVK